MSYQVPVPVTSGATFAQFQAGGASGVLEKLITAQGATLAPTVAPTVAESGSGGTLPVATYYVVVTESNGIGETTASPVSAGQAITLGQDLVVTFPTLKSGNISRNTYVGTASTGPWTLAATGTTTATVTISAPLPANSYATGPPTTNTTGLTYTDASGNVLNKPLVLLRGAKYGNLEDAFTFGAQVVRDFNSGQPESFAGTMTKFRYAHTVFAMLNQLYTDMGTLIDANAGTLGTSQTGIGGRQAVRTWP